MIPPPTFSKPPELVFRAGKMKYANNIVTADKRKGYLAFFCCGPRVVEMVWTSETEQSAPVHLPRGQTKVSFADQCKTGRVLHFEIKENNGTKQFFFWLQDRSEQKDSSYLTTLEGMLSEAPTAPQPNNTVELEDFKKILATVSKGKKDIRLTDVLSSSIITEELNTEGSFYRAKLAGHLPKECSDSDDLVAQVKNPQVSVAASMLDSALSDPATYKQLCRSFEIPETGNNFGVLAFLRAIIDSSKRL